MANQSVQEEQFILRFSDPRLANRIRRALREEESLKDIISLSFPESARQGVITIDGEPHRVDLLDLPTVVESYKTYDDTNLVKTGDIGQILMVGGQVSDGQVECKDGVTPPMHQARQRHFRQLPSVDPQIVAQVEADLLNIIQGGAPAGYEYHDVEEEYVVDPKTGVGSWQVIKAAPAPPAAGAAATPTQAPAPAAGEGQQPATAAAPANEPKAGRSSGQGAAGGRKT